ncbi:hypothetical protein [Sphingomonas sp. ABOLE]|uniref:hypothetical protein n=1 Tax=Sphingomonas sp. ABOLE TaxID=1985878 RepID=UPI0019D0A927|nr:hypothetical protein [Sphingomonas sp. ABOLE]
MRVSAVRCQCLRADGANPLGLFAEKTGGRGLPLDNFPRALTHLAFISAAYFLDRQRDPAYRPIWQP